MRVSRRTALGGGAALLGGMGLSGLADAGPMETGLADVPGGRVRWWRVGAGAKTPLLTLHGGPGAGHNYLAPLRALADERPVIFYDQLGCGASEKPRKASLYTVPRFAAEVDALRAALKLDRVVLLGHSWGSMLAIEYLCEGRGRGVEKLVLSGALASVPQTVAGMGRLLDALPDGAGAKLRRMAAEGRFKDPEYERLSMMFYHRHVCRLATWPPEVNQSLKIADESVSYPLMNGPNEFTIVGTMKDWDRRRDLGRIKVPTLITTGQYDEVTLDCHETIRDGVTGSRLIVFPGLSHMTMNESPTLYASTLRGFMNA